MSDKLSELLPCPFCGSDEVTVGSFGSSCIDPQHYVQCEQCDGATVRHASDGEAIAAWNRRASPAPAISESEDAIQAVRVVLEQNAVYFARSTIEEIVDAARKGEKS
ncbi:Lar family restriction alleviation protein [Burkholderia gladioli]|uniref:Lar family restriction alleviation protein n=1 Tax=Burkholderia gladioli TaxID=28095 RepID=UPI003AFA263B